MKGNKGFAFIETVVALALLGVVAAVFLNSIGTAAKATMVAEEDVTAEGLVRSEIEYIKSCAYQDSATEYPVDATLSIPNRWSMPEPTVEALDVGSDPLVAHRFLPPIGAKADGRSHSEPALAAAPDRSPCSSWPHRPR